MSEIKYMSLKEFMDLGLLQEINRQFLHPMGMALEMIEEDDGSVPGFGGVWDYRDDPEGMYFGEELSKNIKFKEKAEKVKEMFEEKRKEREKKFGWHIQSVEE